MAAKKENQEPVFVHLRIWEQKTERKLRRQAFPFCIENSMPSAGLKEAFSTFYSAHLC